MNSLNPIQEKRNQITNNLVNSFNQPNIVVIDTPNNPIPQLRKFVSDNISKSISGNEDLEKGMGAGKGEGSRGGKIIGHTGTGKPIYGDLTGKEHKGFTPQDHRDAADFYHAQGLMGGLAHRLNKYKRDEHHNLAEAGGNSLKDREKSKGEKSKGEKKKPAPKGSGSEVFDKNKKKANGTGVGKFLDKLDTMKGLDNDLDGLDGFEDLHKSFDYEQDDRDIIRKGEILEKLGMGYGGNNPLTFTKTGKELKAILPITIANLNAKKDALETIMEGYKETAEVDPTEISQSYSIKSVACKRYKYELIDTYDRSTSQYATPTDQQVAMRQYNDCCYVWQSICEDITATGVILTNVEDTKKYTLSVSQLIALSSGL